MLCAKVIVLPQQCSASLVLSESINYNCTHFSSAPLFMNDFFLVNNSNSVFESRDFVWCYAFLWVYLIRASSFNPIAPLAMTFWFVFAVLHRHNQRRLSGCDQWSRCKLMMCLVGRWTWLDCIVIFTAELLEYTSSKLASVATSWMMSMIYNVICVEFI